MNNKVSFYFLAFVLVAFLSVPFLTVAQTTTPNLDLQALVKQLQEQVKALQAQVVSLQTQLTTTREEVTATKEEVAEVKAELKITRSLERGATGDEVRELQEFLKKFPDIYPSGLVTGYFGPQTEAAVKKLQEKQGIEAVGIVGPKTIAKINKLLTEGAGQSGVVPPGLLTAPGIQKKLTPPTPPQVTSTPIFATTTPPVVVSTVATTTEVTPVTTTYIPPATTPSTGQTITQTAPTTATTTTTTSIASSTTASTSTTSAAPITVTYPNGGETLGYLSYSFSYNSSGVSRVGFKLLKGSQVVYETATPTTAGTQLSFSPFPDNPTWSAYQSGSDYKIKVFNWDNQGVYDESDNYFNVDVTRPVVSSVTVSPITANSATITWTTDEPANSQVNYGSTSSNWTVTPIDYTKVTSHSVALTGLTSGTLYKYRTMSTDSVGNTTQTPLYPSEYTFTTPVATPTNVQVVTTSGSQSEPPQMWYYVVFDYTLQPTTQSFNVYRKRPTDASFVKYTYSAQTSVNPSILPLPGSDESNLYHRDANQWQWWTTFPTPVPASAAGEYQFYVTAVNTSGVESGSSETKSFKLYAAPVISSPADGSTISAPFAITVSGDPSASSYGMALYKKTTGDTAWSAWPAPSTNFTYPGSALNPSDNPHRLVVWFSSGIYDRSLFGTSIFNVATTSASVATENNLASILSSLAAVMQELQRLLR